MAEWSMQSIFYSWMPRWGMQGAVHELSVLLVLPYALGSPDLRFGVQVCACVVGAACLAFRPDPGKAIECSVARGQTIGCLEVGVSSFVFGVLHLCL